MKQALKSLVYRTGLYSLLHRVRNRSALTVVSFHRVLDPGDPRFPTANPNYTVTTQELERCLLFFGEHYSVISLKQVRQAAAGAKLPDNPLLITFDDGWRDNAEYALPIVARFKFPAVLFLATDYIASECGFWQEELYSRIVRCKLPRHEIWRRLGLPSPAPQIDLDQFAAACADKLAALSAQARQETIERLPVEKNNLPPRMVRLDDLARLDAAGFTIAGHGASHEPLTRHRNPVEELDASYRALEGLPFPADTHAMSFPHGRYTRDIVRLARRVGFDLLFTSDSRLTSTKSLPHSPLLGRVEINTKMLRKLAGEALEKGLVYWLFGQPISEGFSP